MTESIRLFSGGFGHVSILNVCSNLVTHAHPDVHMIVWLSGAPGQMVVGDELVVPEPDVAVAINSYQPHSHAFADGQAPGTFLAFYIDPVWLATRRNLPAGTPIFAAPVIELDGWMSQMAAGFANRFSDAVEDCDHLEYELERYIDCLIDAADAQMPRLAAHPQRAGRDFRIRKAIALMQANVGERICFDEVARSVGLSRPHFFALFKEHMHLTPNVFWNTLRIAEALRCLRVSDESLISVACNLGFSTQGNFSRFFREHTGVRPTIYRSAISHALAMPPAARDGRPHRRSRQHFQTGR
jgi:AraC family transcriptional regulator